MTASPSTVQKKLAMLLATVDVAIAGAGGGAGAMIESKESRHRCRRRLVVHISRFLAVNGGRSVVMRIVAVLGRS
jgi:hypothetical protein